MGLDRGVILRATGAGLCWLVPAALLNAWAAGRHSGALSLVTFLLILLGFAFTGFAAVRGPLPNPLQHAAAAAVAAFAVIQAVGVITRVARGESVSPVGILFLGLLAGCTGMLGGLLAVRNPNRPASPDPAGPTPKEP